MKKRRSKHRIYQEFTKTKQTTHWDLDYMTNDQIEALLEQTRGRSSKQKKAWIVRIILGLILIILVVLAFLLSNYPS